MAKKTNYIEVGMEFESVKCGKFEVIEVINNSNITIRFKDTGSKKKVRADYIATGKIKDNLYRSVYGVGVFGEGPYTKAKDRMAYNRWKGMLQRCYDEKYLTEKPTYRGCFVCDEWKNFQTFTKWFYENYPNDGKHYCLDKDLKFIGNKEYRPDKCMFVSNEVNVFTTSCTSARGNFMIGSAFEKDCGKFKAACSNPFTGKQENLGRYSSDYMAHVAWRKRKSEHCISLAELQTDKNVRDALIGWSNALINFEVYKDGFNL